jgi:hypothetical protein
MFIAEATEPTVATRSDPFDPAHEQFCANVSLWLLFCGIMCNVKC